MGDYYLYFAKADKVLFTENETNMVKMKGGKQETIFTKDAFHDAIILGKNTKELERVKQGTKASPVFNLKIAGGATETIYFSLRLPWPRGLCVMLTWLTICSAWGE